MLRGYLRRDVVWWLEFTPDGTYDSVWDYVMPMIGRYTIFYFQYQGDVEFVCMLNDWIAASTKFALTITTLPSSG